MRPEAVECAGHSPALRFAALLFARLVCCPAGVLAVQKLGGGQRSWRIAATGVVLQLDASLRIVKKLKLVGTPFKVGGWVGGLWVVGGLAGWVGGGWQPRTFVPLLPLLTP